jgi:CheY-like chemotaxis protein
MGGRELAEHLVGQRPDLRILFMSGHTEDPDLQRGQMGAGAAFVHKPFSPLALARKVRQLLDSDASTR